MAPNSHDTRFPILAPKLRSWSLQHTFLLSLLVLLAGCASNSTSRYLNKDESSLVGGWLSTDLDFTQAFIIRHADRTFTEYRFQAISETHRRAITTTIYGRWKCHGHKYFVTFTSVTSPGWRGLIGRTQALDIISHDPDLFRYFAQDSCPLTEHKLTPQETTRLAARPFSFITAEARKEYRIERQ